jgi:hypothetical protein
MKSEFLSKMGNAAFYALLPDKNPPPIYPVGGVGKNLATNITPEIIKGWAALTLAIIKVGATVPWAGMAGYEFFKAGEAITQENYAEALAWAGTSLMSTSVTVALGGGIHLAQQYLARDRHPVVKKMELTQYYYKNNSRHQGSYFANIDGEFPDNGRMRRWLPFWPFASYFRSRDRKMGFKIANRMLPVEIVGHLHPHKN